MQNEINIRKVAILMPGGIGDALFFLVYYHKLTKSSDDVFFFVINEEVTKELLGIFGVSDSNIIYLGGAGRFNLKIFLKNFARMRRYKFDRVLFLPEVNEEVWKSAFKIYGVTDIILSQGKMRHTIEEVKELLGEAGYRAEISPIDVQIPEKERNNEMEKFLNKFSIIVGIHTGSKKNRRWPIENYLEVVGQISRVFNVGFVFLGTDADIDKNCKLRDTNLLDVYGKLNLRQVFYYIKKCNVFLSNDTGLMHIAAFSGVKTIGLFGPTNWNIHYPYGSENPVIHGNLKCQPCYRRGKLFCNDIPPECIRKISVSEVLDTMKKVISDINEMNVL